MDGVRFAAMGGKAGEDDFAEEGMSDELQAAIDAAEVEPCRIHCSICEGSDHHWMPECDDTGEPVLACKHCEATKPYPDDDEDWL